MGILYTGGERGVGPKAVYVASNAWWEDLYVRLPELPSYAVLLYSPTNTMTLLGRMMNPPVVGISLSLTRSSQVSAARYQRAEGGQRLRPAHVLPGDSYVPGGGRVRQHPVRQ